MSVSCFDMMIISPNKLVNNYPNLYPTSANEGSFPQSEFLLCDNFIRQTLEMKEGGGVQSSENGGKNDGRMFPKVCCSLSIEL